MAKVFLDRLKKRYGWTGGKYRILMSKIVAENSQSIAQAVGKMKDSHFKTQAKKLAKTWGLINLPKIEQVIPGPDVFFRKGAERGKLLSDALRDNLANDIRVAMEEFRTKTGLPGYLYRRGKLKGQMDPKLVQALEGRIWATFQAYTKADPEIGVPANIKAIALTEARSTIDDVKHRYFERLMAENPKMRARKRWRHHPSMSKEPRPGHAAMDGKEIAMDDMFEVPVYVKEDGRWVQTGEIVLMAHPHDQHGGPEDVINCHCDTDYIARMATKKRKGT